MALNTLVAAYRASGLVPIARLPVQTEGDIITARKRARELAALTGLSNQDQVRVATAVSEIARYAWQHGGGAVQFSLAVTPRPQALWVNITDQGSPASPKPEAPFGLQPADIGVVASGRLMDLLDVRHTPSGTVVELAKFLPGDQRLEASAAANLSRSLASANGNPTSQLQEDSRDLLVTLETLRLRETELSRRHDEMRRVNLELEETNRGVVALYAELDEKAAALRRADELKSLFLRHVSHEFRTPLNSILALTQLLLRHTDGDLTSEQERQVGYIRRAAQDLTDMVNDLLDLAKVEAGKTELQIARVNLGQVFGALRGIMRPLVPGDFVTLIIDDPPEDLYLDSDESKLAQILRNLVSNALKFTERGEVRVSSAVNDRHLEICVADTGIGIAPEDQEHIFEEFTQVKSPIQRRVKGTGLGLPLSRRLAKLLGGELKVESQPGQGATFMLSLPLGAQEPAAGANEQAGTILIVDDEPAARYLVRHRFRGSLHHIVEAGSGAEGAERARFDKPLLIVLDLGLPDRSGFDVLDELKSDPATRDIPVFIHTSRILSQADLSRLANRQAGLLHKDAAAWPREHLLAIQNALKEPELFSEGRETGDPQP